MRRLVSAAASDGPPESHWGDSFVTARAWGIVGLVVVLLLAAAAFWVRWETEPPVLAAQGETGELFVGAKPTTVTFDLGDGSGLRLFAVRLRHADGEAVITTTEYPGDALTGGRIPYETVDVTLDPATLGVPQGDAVLVAELTDWSWSGLLAGNTTTVEIPVSIDREAPKLSVSSGLTYVQRAGSGAVRYRVLEATADDGVRVGDATFRGYPFPGGAEGERIALFAIPRDAAPDVTPKVFARDRAGNEREVGWPVRVQERSFTRIPIRLGANFMEGKVPSLAGELGIEGDDAVAVFQTINRDERARNEEAIRAAVVKSGATALFDGAFTQMRNSAVTSQFAEHRTYYVDGKSVSEAIHYGYDLASVSGAPIEASNAGVVVHAEPLGIYGNCVIVDHGLGLMSLYAHLREIDVKVGDRVAKAQRLGRSGATGLAGGDHLHFAILVGATYVDPKEWWDPKWVRDRIAPAMAAALP